MDDTIPGLQISMIRERDRDSKILARMPESAYEQIAQMPHIGKREEISKALAVRLLSLLKSENINVEGVITRGKKGDKIEEKIKRRGTDAPLRDIYGIRFIIRNQDRTGIAKIIQSAFPLTPEKFPDGMPSVREYADPNTRDFVKKNFNPRISDRHSAMHVNIVFLREGSFVCDIAEVQILTPEEMQIFKETREEYENGKH